MNCCPQISIIMAVYNAAQYVGRSIRSVLEQTYRDFELICVDDGSTDDSVQALRDWAVLDPRIRVIPCAHAGACSTLNSGLDAARGKFIAFLDNDDAFHPRTLELAIDALEEQRLDVVAWDRRDVVETGLDRVSFEPLDNVPKVLKLEDPVEWGISNKYVAFWCKMYRREVLSDIRFEPSIIFGDVLLQWRILAKPDLAIGIIPLALHWYCVRPGSVMHSTITPQRARDMVRVIGFIAEYVSGDSALLARLRRKLFPRQIWSAYKVARRQPELRKAVSGEMKDLFAAGVVRWLDLPLVRHLKIRISLAAWLL